MNESKTSKSQNQITRRNFLHTTSTAALGGALLSQLPIERSAFAGGSDTIKIGLVGCGGRGSGAAIDALSATQNVKLVAMGDAFRNNLNNSFRNISDQKPDQVDVPDENKFDGFDAYRNVVALSDVVILATPPGFRPIHFEEAVKQGKHVFMEKPVAVDAPGVRKVLAAAEEAKRKGLKVGVGLQRRHQRVYLEGIQRLQDGAIGDIVSMRCYWNGGGVWVRPRQPGQTEMQYQMRNWYYFNWLCGDHIVEQHIHNLDVINWVKGGFPIRAQGMGGREVRTGIDHGEIYDHHFVEFEYADGSRLYSQCRHIPGTWSDVSESVQGTKGHMNRIERGVIEGENPWRHARAGDPNPYRQEHVDLLEAILNNTPYNEAEFGAKSSMTSILGRLCTYSGKMIDWDTAINSEINLMPESFAFDAEPPVLPDENGFYPIAVPGKTITV